MRPHVSTLLCPPLCPAYRGVPKNSGLGRFCLFGERAEMMRVKDAGYFDVRFRFTPVTVRATSTKALSAGEICARLG